MSLEQELRDGAALLIKLADDLKTGRAQEVDAARSMHVWRHLLREEPAPAHYTESGTEIQMITRVSCIDILKLWGIYVYIATCPRTGIRFVEGVKR